MNLWTAIVAIVVVATISEMYKARLKIRRHQTEGSLDEIMRRLDRLEERIANLETLVLEREKHRKFEDLVDKRG